MNRQSGISLSEVLISLFISSIILVTLMQLYVNTKRQYHDVEELLQSHVEMQWVSELLADSIRRAGFTSCFGVEQLKTADRRKGDQVLTAFKVQDSGIQINHMNHVFTEVIKILNPTQIIISNAFIVNKERPFLIADCEHAEVHHIVAVNKLAQNYRLTLTKPLLFSYSSLTYIGEWFEEHWFIKKNAQGIDTFHYKLFQTEELTSLVHSLHIRTQRVDEQRLIEVVIGLNDKKTHQFATVVRGS